MLHIWIFMSLYPTLLLKWINIVTISMACKYYVKHCFLHLHLNKKNQESEIIMLVDKIVQKKINETTTIFQYIIQWDNISMHTQVRMLVYQTAYTVMSSFQRHAHKSIASKTKLVTMWINITSKMDICRMWTNDNGQ
jgi:hypothetical protein